MASKWVPRSKMSSDMFCKSRRLQRRRPNWLHGWPKDVGSSSTSSRRQSGPHRSCGWGNPRLTPVRQSQKPRRV